MKARIEAIKLGLQTLVYAAILALIVSLFVRPDITAERTGAFFKAFQENNINIKIAALGFNISPREVEELTAQSTVLDEVKLAAVCLASRTCTRAERAHIEKLLELDQVSGYVAAAVQPEAIVTAPSTTESPILVPSTAPVALGAWVVVLGADRDLEAARDEQRKIAERTGLAEIELASRDEWYRTVAFFDTAAQAEAALPDLEQAARRKGIYARATAIWCTGSVFRGAEGVIECG